MLGSNTAFLTVISPGLCLSPSLHPLPQPLLSSLQSFLSPLCIPEFGKLIDYRSRSINLIYQSTIYLLSSFPFVIIITTTTIVINLLQNLFLQILNTRQLHSLSPALLCHSVSTSFTEAVTGECPN